VAVVGASTRIGSVGHQVIGQLLGGGFEGEVIPVNPRYDRIEGLACLPELDRPVDLAVLAVANERLEEQMEQALAAGAGSIAIFASCHGRASTGEPLTARLGRLAGSVPVCGGNGMGFVNVDRRLRICGFHQPWGLAAGGISFLTHSGSLFSAMLHNRRHLAFNLVVSTGNELATTMDEYLAYSVSLETTRVVGLFMETVRNPAGMAAALAQAEEADIPVVALKVGRTERARAAVATHSAALAGEFGAFEAFARAHGVHLVDDMDEMVDTLALFASGRRAGPGGLGTIHDSGGERSLLIDLAARLGVPLATVTGTTRDRLAAVLDPGLEPENPVDAWGTGRAAHDVCLEAVTALADDPGVAAVVFAVDLTAEENPADSYGLTATRLPAVTGKPVAVLTNVATSVDPTEGGFIADSGVPVLYGTTTGLRAVRHLFDHRDHRSMPPVPAVVDHPRLPAWTRAVAAGMDEAAALAMLADFGVPAVKALVATSAHEAREAARLIGHPVAVKTAAPDVAHKSDLGGVRLDLRDDDAVVAAWTELSRLGERVVVEPMAPSGVELALGVVRDPQFGMVMTVAAGGVLIEMVADVATALPPLDTTRAEALVDRLAISPLLRGGRRAPPVDRRALAEAIVAFSAMVVQLGPVLESMDVNPLIAHPAGCVAVDALILPSGSGESPDAR
jgi:acyl-CoA synthetase (NDP forming)